MYKIALMNISNFFKNNLNLVVSIYLGVLTIFVAILSYELQNTQYSWSTISNRAPGNSGKKSALEYLHEKGEDLRDIDLIPIAHAADVNKVGGIHRSSVVGVQLPGADLSRAWLDHTDFSKANLKKSTLNGMRMNSSILDDADLTGAFQIEADLNRSRLTRTIARNLTATGIRVSASTIRKADFLNSDMSHSTILDSILWDTKLQKVIFEKANLANTKFIFVDLRKAKFIGATMSGMSFRNVNANGAKFVNAMMTNVEFSNVNVSNADFSGVKNIDTRQWVNVWAWENELPSGSIAAAVAVYMQSCKKNYDILYSMPPTDCLIRYKQKDR